MTYKIAEFDGMFHLVAHLVTPNGQPFSKSLIAFRFKSHIYDLAKLNGISISE